MSVFAADGALQSMATAAPFHGAGNAQIVARLERIPITPRLMLLRVVVGIATFFDAYTVLAIAFAMPQIAKASASRRVQYSAALPPWRLRS
jgi:putative MFS transporter